MKKYLDYSCNAQKGEKEQRNSKKYHEYNNIRMRNYRDGLQLQLKKYAQ